MKIAVMGAGAMGSIYAALLADAGHQVFAIDVWQEHVTAIQQHGLRVEGASGDRTVKTVVAATTTDGIGICDLVIIATKAAGVGAATKMAESVIGDATLVLTIQNGLGSGERIKQHLKVDNVLLGVAQGFGASIKAPGHAYHNAMSMIRVGAMEGGADARVDHIAQIWQAAGFNVSSYDDINQLIWEKFICNVAYSAPCTVIGCTVAELLSDPDGTELSQSCAIEAFQVAKAKKINLSFDDPVAYVTEFGEKVGSARPSMLLDHIAQRGSEIDAINGMVPVVAAEVGASAPYNDALSRIVRKRESLW